MKPMKLNKNTLLLGISLISFTLTSCSDKGEKADGYGNFEAVATTVSAQGNGQLLALDVEEGNTITEGKIVGYIDTLQISLKKQQLAATKNVIHSKSKGILSQITVLKSQLKTAEISKNRIESLLKEGASTQQKLDDVNGKIDVLNQKIRSIEIQDLSTLNELKSLDVQLKQLDNQIQKSIISNPVNGTILVKYAETFEVVNFGKPIYKIADLRKLQLKVYISETQLTRIKIGQKVTVKVDEGDQMKTIEGMISWIASESEFTPKIIQTKEERANLVYAVKIDVKNDGSLKIGMPAEMWLKTNAKNKK